MSCSSSSSGSNTPSPSSSPTQQGLGSFDPFAVHPFTNFSGPSHSRSTAHQPPKVHVLPHPATLNMDRNAPALAGSSQYPYYSGNGAVSQPIPIPAGSAYTSQGSQTHPSSSSKGAMKPIFVPFRQETSSPDLSDVLRRKPMGF